MIIAMERTVLLRLINTTLQSHGKYTVHTIERLSNKQ